MSQQPPPSSPPALFTIPIEPLGDRYPAGTVVCTEPAPAVYVLTITVGADNRLTTPTCRALLAALDTLEFGGFAPGVVVTTSGIAKFYSNGLDLEHALSTEGFTPDVLYRLFARFLTYPMPTVALLNGHAFAGGLMLAMHHDYRVMNPTRGYCCINELEFGVPLKAGMSAIFRLKTSAATYRTLVLEARRFGGPAALDAGLVDALGGLDAVLAFVAARGLTTKAKTGVYGLLKAEMYRESVDLLGAAAHARDELREKEAAKAYDARRDQGERTARDVLRKGGRASAAKL
ncbi:ClpP/crotonase-like domain-containing protein [Lasiosphaeria miniovina]|uniref:ClpP/crotonase-like domain-containing protein n=1 Tax=Lasiosphaeria miniovina TaxID=1954250 RepID=A0AA40A011_9PEZI|nr:ClpP/crotonase-like domain-containing protein [Lasiosphaeria miniovina]KAK0706767.1 ClpP/crotonase-like domain-containing protein [Lasiosphaeria miniovina]